MCFVSSGFDKELEKTCQQDGLTQNVLISNENQTGRVCELLWHFQGQCTQFTIFVNKLAMAASPLCDGCVPWLLLSLLYSFASHQSVSWVKDLISAVAPENVLCCSPSLRTQAAQWENTCQTTFCSIVVIVGFEWLLASEPLFPSSKKSCQTTPNVTILPFLARHAYDRLSGDIIHKTWWWLLPKSISVKNKVLKTARATRQFVTLKLKMVELQAKLETWGKK